MSIWDDLYGGPKGVNTSGLDPSSLSTTAAKTWGSGPVTFSSPAKTTYSGVGGQWDNSGQGWKNSTGQVVNDLPGYLKMKGLQQTGADFSGYQNQLQGILSDPSKIQQTAGYQFAKDQGEQAINRSAAAKGMLGSGNVLAELAKYGQGMASQEYGGQVNRLSDLMRGAQQFGVSTGYYEPPATGGMLSAPSTRTQAW
ncbi:MAG: hypothetical protein PHE88_11700 [Elusimicrobia bacterium]|nr:hypothetical protein [Elusimicrobiota bacterium]